MQQLQQDIPNITIHTTIQHHFHLGDHNTKDNTTTFNNYSHHNAEGFQIAFYLAVLVFFLIGVITSVRWGARSFSRWRKAPRTEGYTTLTYENDHGQGAPRPVEGTESLHVYLRFPIWVTPIRSTVYHTQHHCQYVRGAGLHM
jgi:hypothetical protein